MKKHAVKGSLLSLARPLCHEACEFEWSQKSVFQGLKEGDERGDLRETVKLSGPRGDAES